MIVSWNKNSNLTLDCLTNSDIRNVINTFVSTCFLVVRMDFAFPRNYTWIIVVSRHFNQKSCHIGTYFQENTCFQSNPARFGSFFDTRFHHNVKETLVVKAIRLHLDQLLTPRSIITQRHYQKESKYLIQ